MLVEFFQDEVPPYTILSHTWGRNEEVSFQDMQDLSFAKQKTGFAKIKYCCEQAVVDHLDWAWIDTCCINKESSAELSEAINSMFRWYREATICYAYLSDVDIKGGTSNIAPSRWFTRGWTLQELIAPRHLIFYDHSWNEIGTKSDLCELLSDITGINVAVLKGEQDVAGISIAERMFWASKRMTTRIEDTAYSLLGIFDANMPLLYGEGSKAFVRLQEAIMSESEDHSLFAWKAFPMPDSDAGSNTRGLLASSPAEFASARNIISLHIADLASPYAITNRGLQIRLPQLPVDSSSGISTTLLGCIDRDHPQSLLAIDLQPIVRERDKFCRVNPHELWHISTGHTNQASINTIYVKKETAHPRTYPMEYWTTIEKLPTRDQGCELHSIFPVELWSKDYKELRGFSNLMNVKAGALFVRKNGSSFVIVLGVSSSNLWCNILPVQKNETVEDVVKRSRSQFYNTYQNDCVKVEMFSRWTLGWKNFVVDIIAL
jgi:hypothetical protein